MASEQAPLLSQSVETEPGSQTKCQAFASEMKKLSSIAMPMVAVSLSQYFVRAAPMMMLGHLGELALSSASIATSLSNVTGFSLIFGLGCALETLCGQAFGAKHYKKVGIYTNGGVIWLVLACIPISILWIYTEKLLILIGQDPLISAEAGKFSIWLIPSLFFYAILQSLNRYLQTQSIIAPMLLCALAALCISLPTSWAVIFKLKLGNPGAALSIAFSYLLNVVFLGLYVKCSAKCEKTRASRDVLSTMREFFRFAIPSAIMVCLEWWIFEIVVLLGGLLPRPELETSVLSICLTITSLHFLVQYSFGAAASTRVSNELGAGKPKTANLAVYGVLILSVSEFIVAAAVLFLCRSILGYAFSNEAEVVSFVRDMIPLICCSIVADSLQAVLSGVIRGSGMQHYGAWVNLGAYYLVGTPISLLLGFVLRFDGQGLWLGLIAGASVQVISLFVITFRTNLEKQAAEARERIFQGEIIVTTYGELN